MASGKVEFPTGVQAGGWETELSEMQSWTAAESHGPDEQKPFFLPQKLRAILIMTVSPSTFCVYQALLGAVFALSLIPRNPEMGILLTSWNLSFLICKMGIKCLSPGWKSASTYHFSSD